MLTSSFAFNLFLLIWILVAAITFIVLFRITAPYGRHTRKNWGLEIDNRLGWIVMEIVSPLSFTVFFIVGNQPKTFLLWFFWGLWMLHYTNRSLIFPFRIKTNGKKMPISIVLSAVFFNLVNGFINGYYFGNLVNNYPEFWYLQLSFIIGISFFILGFCINIYSDEILLALRKGEEKGYKIPYGGLYQWISSPNYFGEMIEWLGYALLTASPAAGAFAIWTIANLLPRAIANHQWYQNKFPEYPKERKAIIPFLW